MVADERQHIIDIDILIYRLTCLFIEHWLSEAVRTLLLIGIGHSPQLALVAAFETVLIVCSGPGDSAILPAVDHQFQGCRSHGLLTLPDRIHIFLRSVAIRQRVQNDIILCLDTAHSDPAVMGHIHKGELVVSLITLETSVASREGEIVQVVVVIRELEHRTGRILHCVRSLDIGVFRKSLSFEPGADSMPFIELEDIHPASVFEFFTREILHHPCPAIKQGLVIYGHSLGNALIR